MKMDGVKGLIFDYGATIDSNGMHWAEVIWDAYQYLNVPVSKQAFRDAYVTAERMLALKPLVLPEHNFYDVLLLKTEIQIATLVESGELQLNMQTQSYPSQIALRCYHHAQQTVEQSKYVLEKLSKSYPMVLVSNFYGNIGTVVKDFGIDHFFNEIIESAVVGVRKPDPEIFRLGVKALGLSPEEVVVIGDSYSKDIQPAELIGCRTIWLKGKSWDQSDDRVLHPAIIVNFKELETLLL